MLVNKPKGRTSFDLVYELRKILGVKKIGHAGTLDPFATGVMIMLIGRNYTKLSDQFLTSDKEYLAELHLGASTDTYDLDGQVVATSDHIPTLEEIQMALTHFQGEIEQIPPMFSAKKIKGKKLYELARQGVEIERKPVKIQLTTDLISYDYPKLTLQVKCSKGTYIRSIAFDLGNRLGCLAHLTGLIRTRSGCFVLDDCVDGKELKQEGSSLVKRLLKSHVPPQVNN